MLRRIALLVARSVQLPRSLGEHYGNIVTYLRLHGIVPPSSRPAPR